MSIAMAFTPVLMTAAQYHDIIRRLEAAGAGSPKGRTYHVAYESGGRLHVFDVWDSQEDFDAFGKTLLPILREVGVDHGQPELGAVQNIILG